MGLVDRVDQKTAGLLVHKVDVVIPAAGVAGQIDDVDAEIPLWQIEPDDAVLDLVC